MVLSGTFVPHSWTRCLQQVESNQEKSRRMQHVPGNILLLPPQSVRAFVYVGTFYGICNTRNHDQFILEILHINYLVFPL
jgi:hypothetical protein